MCLVRAELETKAVVVFVVVVVWNCGLSFAGVVAGKKTRERVAVAFLQKDQALSLEERTVFWQQQV
jgi:hypothetical protein